MSDNAVRRLTPHDAAMLLRDYAYKVTNGCDSPAWADTRVSVEDCHRIANLIDAMANASPSELLRRIDAAITVLTTGKQP